jgi:hypothetical protein
MRLNFLTPFLALIFISASTRAALTFTLASTNQTTISSNEVFFTGTLSNISPTTNLFLNGIQFSLTGAASTNLLPHTNIFFANVPGILLSNETYTDTIFAVALNPNTKPGNYSGQVTLQGGTNIFSAGNLGSQTFQISLPTAALNILLTNGSLALVWPSFPGDSILQQNFNLTTTNWTIVTNMPTLANNQYQITLPLSPTNQFFRLNYP